MNNKTLNEELWEFPCQLSLKAMGLAEHPLEEIICTIADTHCSVVYSETLTSRESRTGKYRSITLSVQCDTKEQVEKLYLELGEREEIKWTL